MTVESWIRDVAQEFWVAARQSGPFPRDLESAIAWVLPLGILRVPHLWVSDVHAALQQRRLPFPLHAEDRRLHGCLCAYAGKGLIIVDGSDKEKELHYTVAHEVAHFLLDYQMPRIRTIEKLGEDIKAVLDGIRLPTDVERIDAGLACVSIGVYGHFMYRDDVGVGTAMTAHSEAQAHALALEVLSPETEVRRNLPRGFSKMKYENRVASLTRTLGRRFVLPSQVAREYAGRLCRQWFGGPPIREWLGLP